MVMAEASPKFVPSRAVGASPRLRSGKDTQEIDG